MVDNESLSQDVFQIDLLGTSVSIRTSENDDNLRKTLAFIKEKLKEAQVLLPYEDSTKSAILALFLLANNYLVITEKLDNLESSKEQDDEILKEMIDLLDETR